MAKREVKSTGKNSDGDITKLCNSTADWSPRYKAQAIKDIDNGDHSYFVDWSKQSENGRQKTEVHVVNGFDGKYLRTDHDDTEKNNLLELPDC